MSGAERARIGVVADTHANMSYMELARDLLVGGCGIDRAYHLGDSYEDARAMLDWGVPVIQVPGTYCPEYASGRAPRKVCERVAGRTHLLVHSESDLGPADLERADVLFVGHTHRFELSRGGMLFRVNPGHMKASSHKGRPATCAVVEATPASFAARIVAVDGGEVLAEETWS